MQSVLKWDLFQQISRCCHQKQDTNITKNSCQKHVVIKHYRNRFLINYYPFNLNKNKNAFFKDFDPFFFIVNILVKSILSNSLFILLNDPTSSTWSSALKNQSSSNKSLSKMIITTYFANKSHLLKIKTGFLLSNRFISLQVFVSELIKYRVTEERVVEEAFSTPRKEDEENIFLEKRHFFPWKTNISSLFFVFYHPVKGWRKNKSFH